jgi:hypothetical protein
MNDDSLLGRELRAMLQTEGGRRRFCKFISSYCGMLLAESSSLQVAVLATMPYRAYLLTQHWRNTAAAAKSRAGNRCQICNSKQHLEAHHRTYERRGFESESDLTVLCTDCHEKFHATVPPDESGNPSPITEFEVMTAGMTEAEEIECLMKLIADKRRQQGIPAELSPIQVPVRKTRSVTMAQSVK